MLQNHGDTFANSARSLNFPEREKLFAVPMNPKRLRFSDLRQPNRDNRVRLELWNLGNKFRLIS